MKISIKCNAKELVDFMAAITCIPDITPEPDLQQEQEPKQEQKQAPAPKPAAKQKIELDVGKIKALHDAGWSMQKIADEMNVSMQTIANRLKEAKNE